MAANRALAGSTLFAIVLGGPSFDGYGRLTDTFKGGGAILIAPILLGAMILIGLGARPAAAARRATG